MIKDILILVSTILITLMLCYEYFLFMSIPVVAKSWNTGECVYIEFSDHREDCSKLDTLDGYEQIWVK